MSLVNQVLKDLEQRQATHIQEVEIDDLHYAPVSPAPAKRNYKWMVFAGVLILLGVATASGVYLFDAWELQTKQQQVATTTTPVVAAPIVKQDAVVTETQPQIKPETHNKPTPTAQATPVVEQKQVVAIAKPAIVSMKKSSTVATEEAQGTLAKKIVPLSSEQRAQQAYQDGHGYITRHDYRKAESALRSALALEPAHLKARELLSGVYISQGRWIEASELLREGVAIAPQHHTFIKLYARSLMQLKRDAQAITILSEHKPAPAQDPEHYALLAALYQRQQNHEAAAHLYSDILKLNPGMGIWWVGMGISLEAMGEHQQAVAAYQQARKTGTLNSDVARYTDNRLLALDAIHYPIN